MRPIEFNLSLCWSYRSRLAFQLQLLGIELQTEKWFLYISDLTFSIHFFAKRTLGTHKLLDNFVKPVHELGSVWHLILQVKITYFFVNLWSIIKVMIFFFISASISSYVSQGAGASPLERGASWVSEKDRLLHVFLHRALLLYAVGPILGSVEFRPVTAL